MGFFDEAKKFLNQYKNVPVSSVVQSNALNTELILRELPCFAVKLGGAPHKRNFGKDLESFKCKSITARTPLRTFQTFVAFDTETTGLTLSDDVVEVAAIRFVDFVPKLQFSTLIRPRKLIPHDATAVNHISNNMVANAPLFHELIPSFDFVFQNHPLVAHNAMFDVKMMYVNGYDAMSGKKVYDTCAMSKKLCPSLPNHKLTTLCNAHGIVNGNAHRAGSDALACGLMFVQFLMQHYECRNTDELRAKLNT